MAITTPISTRGVQYSRCRRITSASSAVMSARNVGRGGLSLHRKCDIKPASQVSREALVEEGFELGEVLRHEARRRRRRGRTSGVARPLRPAADLAEHPFHVGFDEEPGAHVLGLLLAPDDLGLLESAEMADHLL